MSADTAVTEFSRWIAARTTRRSFLGKLGRVMLFLAVGPSLATLLSRRAEARVCGQSGVSGKCATFDCFGPGRVWGYCWYATGCCAGGGLKKICDCCTYNFPNVHGYCPAGHNVECIVESCWADPRVQTVPVSRAQALSRANNTAEASRTNFGAGSAPLVFMASENDPRLVAALEPLAAVSGASLLLTTTGRLAGGAIAELQRLGSNTVRIYDPTITSDVRDDLSRYGISWVDATVGGGVSSQSVALANAVRSANGAQRVLVLPESGSASETASAVGALAALLGLPVVVGFAALQSLLSSGNPPRVSYLIGPELSGLAGQVPGGVPLRSGDIVPLSVELAAIAFDHFHRTDVTVVVCPDILAASTGLSGYRGVVFYHRRRELSAEITNSLRGHQSQLRRGYAVGAGLGLDDSGYYEFQSACNRYDTYRLIGVAGQGLPVIDQPLPEREQGAARVFGQPSKSVSPAYWIGRANPDRSR